MCSQLKVHTTRQRKKRADKAKWILLRDKSPRFGEEQQVCAARTPLTKQVNMGSLTAAEGRAHGAFKDGIKAPKCYTPVNWGAKFWNAVLSHALIFSTHFSYFCFIYSRNQLCISTRSFQWFLHSRCADRQNWNGRYSNSNWMCHYRSAFQLDFSSDPGSGTAAPCRSV